MRRSLLALLVLLLAASPASFMGASVAAQDSPSEVAEALADCTPGRPGTEEERTQLAEQLGLSTVLWYPWEGVCRPIAESSDASIPTPADAPMQPYAVGFQEQFASAIPIGRDPVDEGLSAEFMVIYVREGTFAIDVETDDQGVAKKVVVSTLRDGIPTLSPWNEAEATTMPYTETGDVLMIDGQVCTRACPVDPEVPVALGPGDIAIAEEGALCYYCLIENGQIADNDVEGLLEVYVLMHANEFSWIESWDRHQQGLQSRDGTQPAMRGWAYFNPPSGCH